MRDFAEDLKTLQLEADEIKDDFSYKSSQLTNSLFICEILTEMRQEIKEMKKDLAEMKEKQERKEAISTRKKFVGEWKMIEHENFEGFMKLYTNSSLKLFSNNPKYELVDGKLKQTNGSYVDLIEGGKQFGGKDGKDLFVEDDHVKSRFATSVVDRYIENEKLYVVQKWKDEVWKRVYEKI